MILALVLKWEFQNSSDDAENLPLLPSKLGHYYRLWLLFPQPT